MNKISKMIILRFSGQVFATFFENLARKPMNRHFRNFVHLVLESTHDELSTHIFRFSVDIHTKKCCKFENVNPRFCISWFLKKLKKVWFKKNKKYIYIFSIFKTFYLLKKIMICDIFDDDDFNDDDHDNDLSQSSSSPNLIKYIRF